MPWLHALTRHKHLICCINLPVQPYRRGGERASRVASDGVVMGHGVTL
jgi:hypothetical protein